LAECDGLIDVEYAKRDGTLTINSLVMQCPAWAVFDVTPLWEPPDLRGVDRLIPGRPGRRALPRRVDESARSLLMVIDGSVDWNGAVWPNEREGLRRNLKQLRTFVFTETNAPLPLTLTKPAGAGMLSGGVYAKLSVGTKIEGLWRAVVDLELPDGELVET